MVKKKKRLFWMYRLLSWAIDTKGLGILYVLFLVISLILYIGFAGKGLIGWGVAIVAGCLTLVFGELMFRSWVRDLKRKMDSADIFFIKVLSFVGVWPFAFWMGIILKYYGKIMMGFMAFIECMWFILRNVDWMLLLKIIIICAVIVVSIAGMIRLNLNYAKKQGKWKGGN